MGIVPGSGSAKNKLKTKVWPILAGTCKNELPLGIHIQSGLNTQNSMKFNGITIVTVVFFGGVGGGEAFFQNVPSPKGWPKNHPKL